MIYFVPSWYHENEYKENENYWYIASGDRI